MRSWTVLAVVLATGAGRASDARFEELKAGAAPFEGGLGTFLEQYTGDCGEASSTARCKQAAAEFRAKAAGKRFYALIREDDATMVAFAPSRGEGDFTVQLTPFFPGSDHALTTEVPRSTDGRGNPRFALVNLPGALPEGASLEDVERMFSRRQVRVEMLFTPLDVWTFARKGGGRMVGVRGRIDALIVTARTGEVLARLGAAVR